MTNPVSSNPRRFLDARRGPFEKLPRMPVPWIFKILKRHYEDRAAGLNDHELKNFQVGFTNLWNCALKVAEVVEHDQGQRFQLSSRELGRSVGISQSTASRCLRKLRSLGVIALWRAHVVSYVAMMGWVGVAAIYQVVTRPFGNRSPGRHRAPKRTIHRSGPGAPLEPLSS